MKLMFTLFFFSVFGKCSEAQSLAGNHTDRISPAKTSLARVNLNGQWRGSFQESSNSSNPLSIINNSQTTYVLELDIQGNKISGYSYTYFTDLGPKRYYTICRITGTVNRAENSIEVVEIERVRYNTPPEILNCFQVHRLQYVKGEGNTEYLKGDWVPAPNQRCGGKGETTLSRETLTRAPFAVKMPPKKEETVKTTKPASPKPQPTRPLAKAPAAKPQAPKPETRHITSEIPVEKQVVTAPAEKKKQMSPPPAPVYRGYEKRANNVVKSINIENTVFQVDFYDNGEIDGDSISVFFNGKLIVSHKMLTAQPLTLTLSIDENYKQNIITMYAENLGSIPPNTAVMIVRDGNKRYEVRMESDLGKSGSVIFTHDDN